MVFDPVSGAVLYLAVDFADVAAHHAQAEHLQAAQQPDGADDGGPARDGPACKVGDQGVKQPEHAEHGNEDAQVGDELQRLHAEAGDAVQGKGEHLFQRVFGFPREPLLPVVIDIVAAVADQRHNAPQEEVCLPVFRKGLQGPPAHQAVVRVVEHHVHAQDFHHLVEALGGGALEPGVGVPFVAHAVYHVAALQVFLHKLVQHAGVVLQVGVQADGAVAGFPGGHQAAEQGVLMAPVVGQLYPLHIGIFLMKPGNEGPGGVPAAVVHQQHPAFRGRQPLFPHGIQLLRQAFHRFRKHRLLVIAGNDKIDYR